jgi:hypothetical protein
MPTSLQVPVSGTEAVADAIYKDARAVVFLSPVSDDVIRLIQDKGRSVILMPDPAQWSAQFAAHTEVFGPGTQNNT